MRIWLVAGLILLGMTAPSQAGFKQALDAYKKGDHQAAYQRFMPLAKMGDPRSRLMLGVMYGEGKGVKGDDFLAHVWFILAANAARTGKLHDLAEKYRSVFSEDLTTADMIEAGRLARQWSTRWRREMMGWGHHVDDRPKY